MRSDRRKAAPLGLRLAAAAGLLFLHLPILLIFVYAFTTEEKSYQCPPPGLTAQWFAAAWSRPNAGTRWRSRCKVAAIWTVDRSLCSARVRGGGQPRKFFGAGSNIVSRHLADSAAGHHNRHLAALGFLADGHPVFDLDHRARARDVLRGRRLQQCGRPLPPHLGLDDRGLIDLGADGFQTFRHVVLPNIGTALLAGGMLAFALSFDEVIVTTFTAGQQQTLPIGCWRNSVRQRQRPVTNVVAMVVVLVTLLPILCCLLPDPRWRPNRRRRANEVNKQH